MPLEKINKLIHPLGILGVFIAIGGYREIGQDSGFLLELFGSKESLQVAVYIAVTVVIVDILMIIKLKMAASSENT